MANQADFNVRTMCRVLKVSAAGYYGWRDRAPSTRCLANAVLTERIREIHHESGESYGMPRVRAELLEQGHPTSRKRVARLMRLARIRGISRRRGFMVTTQRDLRQRPAPDLVNRKFVANGPNELWVADMTYVPTWAGFVYLAVVLDVWSRRVIGWSIGQSMTADLVVAALNMALSQRRPDSVIHHSDQEQPIHQHYVRHALPSDGGSAIDGIGRRCLRQCDGRELLRQPGVRTDRPPQFPKLHRGSNRIVHLDRRLVQPAAPALGTHLSLADQLRKEPCRPQRTATAPS